MSLVKSVFEVKSHLGITFHKWVSLVRVHLIFIINRLKTILEGARSLFSS